MKKKHALSIVIIILLAVHAFAVDYPEPTSWVNDYAGILTAEQKQEFDTILQDFENKTTHQIFISIMNSLPADMSLEAYVNELFARWKPGQEGKDNGVLLAIFIKDRKLRIEVGYGLEAQLSEGYMYGDFS